MSLEWRHHLPWFQLEMAKKLGLPKNEAKGSYMAEKPEDLFLSFVTEAKELSEALSADQPSSPNGPAIISECADVANFAMMIAATYKEDAEDEETP